MDAARKFVDKGQIDKAVKEYLRIVREDPKDVRVWLKIGDLYAKKGSKQEASETYLKVARFYQEQGFYLKAVAVYKQILKLDPRLVEVNLKLAELYRQLGLLSDAMQHFELVAAHFHRDGKTKEALATVRQLVDLDPENVATRIKLAELYSKEGMTVEAVAEFTAVCETLRKLNRQDDFIKVAERLLWHKPEMRELNRELAGLYLRRNDPRRALQKLQICFKADPRDVETLGLLAQAFQALDQKSKTVSVLKELARVFDENKQRDKAEEVHRKILQFIPGDNEAIAYLGDKAKHIAPVSTTNAPMPKSNPPSIGAKAPKPQLNLTSEVEALRPHMTGAMPLVDEKSLSDDFALPEYGDGEDEQIADADFQSDMQIDESSYSRGQSSAGEEHADEISKILTETDVYLKYGLHQKAVEHLRRVFALDPENIEAREKLKEVYLAQGREDDAIAELIKLAESTVAIDPERAEAYLREVLTIDGTHRGAMELARRHRLDLSGGPQVEVIDGGDDIELDPDDLGHGAVAAVEDDIDFDDIDFGDQSKPHHPGAGVGAVSRADSRADSFDGIDPALFSSQPVARVDLTGGRGPDGRRLGSEGPNTPMPERTRQIDPAEAHALAMSGEPEPLEFEPDAVDVAAGSPPGGWGGHMGRIEHAVDAQLDDALGDDIDEGVAEELSAASALPGGAMDLGDDDLPFDPAAARAFDAGVQRTRRTSEGEGSVPTFDPAAAAEFDRDRPGLPSATATPSSFGAAALPAQSFGYGRPGAAPQAQPQPQPDDIDLDALPDYGSATIDAPPELDDAAPHGTIDEDDYQQIGDSAVVAAEDVAAPMPEASLEDDLDEADFYVSQGMHAEAVDLLRVVLERHPNHPLVIAKLRDAHAYASGAPRGSSVAEIGDEAIEGEESIPADSGQVEAAPYEGAAYEGSGSTEALGLDEIEELGPDDIAAEPDDGVESALGGGRQGGSAVGRAKKKQQVVLEKPVEDSDADTHYDLGLAYKEMGLWEEAIKAFDKVAQVRGREVQCRLMIGLCHREQGNHSEAVHQFKLGLHEPSVTDREKQSLFYEIGASYEGMGDPREALYYFEMVVKRDPSFLDASDRAAHLRAAASRGGRGRAASDDPDGAIDSLLEDSGSH
ncbi:MAG TPA: tetratricopeptide repeat protein [Kofleriaceae bacterium]|nr:tetratricopeptide repeat protein [Kofleriaceae bacterium]